MRTRDLEQALYDTAHEAYEGFDRPDWNGVRSAYKIDGLYSLVEHLTKSRAIGPRVRRRLYGSITRGVYLAGIEAGRERARATKGDPEGP